MVPTPLVNTLLAVSVINYDAVLKNNILQVQWNTTHEVNSDYFTVERWANGQNFEIIMVISGKGGTTAAISYTFTNNAPLTGASYYRLSATDKNDDKKIVGIRSINNKPITTFSMVVKPNPAINNEVNAVILSAKKQLLNIKIVTLNGAAVYHKSMSVSAGSNQLKFYLPNGTYVVRIKGADNTRHKEKIIVQ